jgi:nitric oxide reductase subunit B
VPVVDVRGVLNPGVRPAPARRHLDRVRARGIDGHTGEIVTEIAPGEARYADAGIFGFLINLPVVSYFEIGTALTANHGHATMMGVYGILTIGLALFCLRYLIPAARWPERWARIAFWSTNFRLAWMCFATLLPRRPRSNRGGQAAAARTTQ